jgi:hypothetical protein
LYVKISIKYSTNFVPQIYNPCQNQIKTLRGAEKVFTKNFFITYIILEYLSEKYLECSFKLLCLPTKHSVLVFLRAPNRSKGSQILLKTRQYKLLLILTLPLKYQVSATLLLAFFYRCWMGFQFFETNTLNYVSLILSIRSNYYFN